MIKIQCQAAFLVMTPGEFWWAELTSSTTDHVIFVIRPELPNIETIKYVLMLSCGG